MENVALKIQRRRYSGAAVYEVAIHHLVQRETGGCGDIVTMRSQKRTEDPFSVFPVMEHTLRTEGFFKVRGVNLNHGDLEDFMFSQPTITDFRGQAEATDGNDLLRLQIEIQRDAIAATLVQALKTAFKAKFELTPEIDVLETGTLAREFEKSVKAPRFMDLRK